jgi:hypothetical protein
MFTALDQTCRALGFKVPTKAVRTRPQHTRTQTVFRATAIALRAQHSCDETSDTVRRLLAALTRQRLMTDPNSLQNWNAGLFEQTHRDRYSTLQRLAKSGLPRATLLEQDAFNPAWTLALAHHFGNTRVFIVQIQNYGLPTQTIRLLRQDPGITLNARPIYNSAQIIQYQARSANAVWILQCHNLFYALVPRRLGPRPATTPFSIRFTRFKTALIDTVLDNTNRALAGYLSTLQSMDHSVSYFQINSQGVATLAPFEHALELGKTMQDFTHRTTDVDSLLLRGSNLDVIFHHCFSLATPVAMNANTNKAIPEMGGNKSKLEWVEVSHFPLFYVRREHAEVRLFLSRYIVTCAKLTCLARIYIHKLQLTREKMAYWTKKLLRLGHSGNFHDCTGFSIPSTLFKIVLQDVKSHLLALGDDSFQFIFYTYGHQTPVQLMTFVDDFIRADFQVIADIATVYTQYPAHYRTLLHERTNVLLFKPIPLDMHTGRHKYNKVHIQHTRFNLHQNTH